MRFSDENTEAILTDYLDGTLDAARRAELEAYLAANPLEREALDLLRAQRDLLRALPRERVPDDLGEHVTAQLERSVLLEKFDDISSAPVRPSHWRSRVLSTAALLFISAGVLGVIYYIVSPPRSSHDVAYTPVLSEDGGKATVQAVTLPASRGTVMMKSAAPTPPPGAAGTSLPENPAPLAAAPPPAPMFSHAKSRDLQRQFGPPARGFGGGGFDRAEPHVVRIYSDDPDATRDRIEEFLRQGGWSVSSASATRASPEKRKEPVADAVQSPAEKIAPDTSKKDVGGRREASVAPPEPVATLTVRVEADQAQTLAAVLPLIAQHSQDRTPTTFPAATRPAAADATSPLVPLTTLRIEILPTPRTPSGPTTTPATQP